MGNNLFEREDQGPPLPDVEIAARRVKHPDKSKFERKIGVCRYVRTYLVGATIGRPLVRLQSHSATDIWCNLNVKQPRTVEDACPYRVLRRRVVTSPPYRAFFALIATKIPLFPLFCLSNFPLLYNVCKISKLDGIFW